MQNRNGNVLKNLENVEISSTMSNKYEGKFEGYFWEFKEIQEKTKNDVQLP